MDRENKAPATKIQVSTFALATLGLVLFGAPHASNSSAAESTEARQSSQVATNAKPAKLKISGYGFFGNRQLKRSLVTLELAGRKPQHFGAAFVEDAMLILAARIKRDGYLHPKIVVYAELDDGGKFERDADALVDEPLPRPLRITKLHFAIKKGLLYHFRKLEFEGLTIITSKEATGYFVERGSLIHLKRARIYTPQRLEQGVSSIADVLDRGGYQEAKVQADNVQVDDETGAVDVRIRVEEGRRFIVRSVREQLIYPDEPNPVPSSVVFTNRPYSRIWVQDYSLGLKTNQFARGFPDATVEMKELARKEQPGIVSLDLAARVNTGPQVRIGAIEFQGQKRTRQNLMSRRVRIKRGELLNPIRVEEGRFRLAELGIFDTVDFAYKPEDPYTRDVLFKVKEGRRIDLSLLFGYGSYELLRGGIEAELYNIWGRAHSARVKAVQSFKMSSGEFTYTIPELVGRDVDLFFHGFGLRREEISFTREEYGGGLGAHKFFKQYATDISARYNYQVLNAAGIFPAVASEGLTNPAVGSILMDIKHDRRDNPLYPHRGYKVFTSLESATEYLGGDANYQRIELMPSWHTPIGREGTFISIGVSHGVAVAFGSPANNLPFNKRFFPGGDNSIRGYQEGEASPRNPQGNYVGAETYLLGTVEVEQQLTSAFSLVAFPTRSGLRDGSRIILSIPAYSRWVVEFAGRLSLARCGSNTVTT